jgi:hypothetical protein
MDPRTRDIVQCLLGCCEVTLLHLFSLYHMHTIEVIKIAHHENYKTITHTYIYQQELSIDRS